MSAFLSYLRARLPGLLLSRPAIYGAVAVAMLGTAAAWSHARDNRIRQEAVVAERIATLERERVRLDGVVLAAQDSLRRVRAHTDTVRVATEAAGAVYSRERARVDTSAAVQPACVPQGSVVVSVAYVAAADSVAALVPVLVARIEAERVAADARIQAADSVARVLAAENAELRIAATIGKPGKLGHYVTVAGTVAGAVAAGWIAHSVATQF